jgi:hypothetical protein
MAEKSICTIPDCGKPVKQQGWCNSHYARWRLHGNPLAGRTPEGEPARYISEVVLAYEGDECVPWPYAKGSNGYALIMRGGRLRMVSRIVCEEEHGPPPTPKHEAAHSCGKGHLSCVAKRHLDWKTSAQNKADKIGHGTHDRGERNTQAKLTEAQVIEIRAMIGLQTQTAIARQFGVSIASISRVKSRKRWAWLD